MEPKKKDFYDVFTAAAQQVIKKGRLELVTKAMADAGMAAKKPGAEVTVHFKRMEDLLISLRIMKEIFDDQIDLELSKKTSMETAYLSLEFKNGSIIIFKPEPGMANMWF